MIDHERLAELEADFGSDELRDIIAVFLDEAAEAVEALAAAVAAHAAAGGAGADGSGPVAWRERLHFLKGCARTIGAGRLGNLCDRLERQQGFGAAEQARLEREFAALREALDGSELRKAG